MRKLALCVITLMLLAGSAFAEIGSADRAALVQRALDALPKSYAPYSNFNVSAAVLCDSGEDIHRR